MCSSAGRERSVERIEVLDNERLTEGVGLISFSSEEIAARVRPGQFVHLRIAQGADFILRRPFSVHRTGPRRIDILYQVLGRGTRELSLARPGHVMDALGPLGTGWRVPEDAAHVLLVAGGLGVAPMGMLIEELAVAGVAVSVALGAPTGSRLLARDLLAANARRVLTATDDGTSGVEGFVTEVSDVLIATDSYDLVCACGPEVMCRAVADQAAAKGIRCQVSLERLMACGVGACLSCVVSTTDGLKKACVEGPVFDADAICWDTSEVPPTHGGGRS